MLMPPEEPALLRSLPNTSLWPENTADERAPPPDCDVSGPRKLPSYWSKTGGAALCWVARGVAPALHVAD